MVFPLNQSYMMSFWCWSSANRFCNSRSLSVCLWTSSVRDCGRLKRVGEWIYPVNHSVISGLCKTIEQVTEQTRQIERRGDKWSKERWQESQPHQCARISQMPKRQSARIKSDFLEKHWDKAHVELTKTQDVGWKRKTSATDAECRFAWFILGLSKSRIGL